MRVSGTPLRAGGGAIRRVESRAIRPWGGKTGLGALPGRPERGRAHRERGWSSRGRKPAGAPGKGESDRRTPAACAEREAGRHRAALLLARRARRHPAKRPRIHPGGPRRRYWEHEQWCAEHVDASVWREALARARPGRTPKKSWSWWAKRFGMPNVEERLADWPDHAHRLDVPVHKWMSRERMYAGHARAHGRRKAAGRKKDCGNGGGEI